MTFYNDVNGAIDALRAHIGHDKISAEILDKLVEHISSPVGATISIEKAINERVSSVYAIEHRTETSQEDATETFTDLFNAALSRVGYLMSLARIACDDMQIEYLTAKVDDTIKGAFDENAVPYTIPSRADANQSAEAIENFVAPLVEMTQRVLNVQSDRAFVHNLKQAQYLLDTKMDALARALETMAAFDEANEEAFMLDMDAKLAIEQTRLSSFKETGAKDPLVEINPMFGSSTSAYEDTLLYNIQLLSSRRVKGSDAKWAYEHSKGEAARLEIEIADLHLNIERLAADQTV